MGDGEEASGGGSRKKGRQNTNALFLVSTKTGEVRVEGLEGHLESGTGRHTP
jgi:hypothetical protein